MNENLLQVQPGDKNTVAVISLANFTPNIGGSGRVEPGLYEITVRSAAWVKKKDGNGVNLDMAGVISAPQQQSGVPIRETHPAPVGDESSNKGFKFVPSILRSALSVVPEDLAAASATGAAPIAFSPAKLEGRKIYVELRDGEPYEGKVKSEVKGYITKAEYDANPGPFNKAAAGALATSVVQQPAQVKVPEVAAAPVTPPAVAPAAALAATKGW